MNKKLIIVGVIILIGLVVIAYNKKITIIDSNRVVPVTLGTVKGIVTLSPICPVERIPPDPQCAPKPYSTIIRIYALGDQNILKEIKSDSTGVFETELLPGSYELNALNTNGSRLPRCQKITVAIKPNQTTDINIFCDTGIR